MVSRALGHQVERLWIVKDELALFFSTAWSTPEPIFLALSSLLPEMYIVVRYADEDIGSNCRSSLMPG